MLLIISNERDITSDYIVQECQNRSIAYYRLNTERLPEYTVRFRPHESDQDWSLELGNRRIKLKEVKAGYFRRPGQPKLAPSLFDADSTAYCEGEWIASLSDILESLEGRWLNAPSAIVAAENKPRQLISAIRAGFQVPETLITNSYSEAKNFTNKGLVVAKPLRNALIGSGESERVIFTTRIPPIESTAAIEISACPLILQTEIRKKYDIRATVVGEKVFAAELHSQLLEDGVTDWRKGSNLSLPHQPHELPPAIEQKCLDLTRNLNLRFGAIDLVLDNDGRYWFLEINPNGQWAWIENRTGLAISAAIVDELEMISQHA